MCRFIVYHGPAITMASLVTEPEHAMIQLAQKAYCCHTPINADGFGLAWYHQDIHVPGAYKDITPAWNSQNLKQIARAIKSHCFFAHVRAASAGGVNYPNCHPFLFKNLSFMHNGTVPYFKQVKRSMLSRISERAFQLIQGTTDSEVMFAMFVTNFEKLTGLGSENKELGSDNNEAYEYVKQKEDFTAYLVSALKATLRQVHYLVLEHEFESGVQKPPEHELQEMDVDGASVGAPLPPTCAIGRLNLAVTDGQSTCTSRYVTSKPDTAHSLYYSMGSKYELNAASHRCQVLAASGGVSSAGVLSPPTSPMLIARPLTKKERVVVVSSEPLAVGYNCAEVPVNHMVVSGPNAHFEITPCVEQSAPAS